MPKILEYTCTKGHIYKDYGPWELGLTYEGQRIASGPLCPYCYMEWLKATFPMKEAALPPEPIVVELGKEQRGATTQRRGTRKAVGI